MRHIAAILFAAAIAAIFTALSSPQQKQEAPIIMSTVNRGDKADRLDIKLKETKPAKPLWHGCPPPFLGNIPGRCFA